MFSDFRDKVNVVMCVLYACGIVVFLSWTMIFLNRYYRKRDSFLGLKRISK